jgi:preprotein translocase subunit SecD
MRTVWLRFALVIAMLIPAVLIGLGAVDAQFRPGGGIPPQPPIGPQPIGPRNPGIQPGMPGNPNPQPIGPNNPIPQPGGPNIPNTQPGQIQIPKVETVWRCSNCGKEIGKGAFPPATCPYCGAKLINGVGNGGDNPFKGNIGQPAGNPGPAPGPASPSPAPPASSPITTPAPSPVPPTSSPVSSSSSDPWPTSSSSSGYSPTSGTSILVFTAAGIGFTVLIVLAVGFCFLLRFIVRTADSDSSPDTQPARTRRRPRNDSLGQVRKGTSKARES